MNLKHIGESLHVTESNLPNSQFESVTMSASTFRKAKIDRAVIQEADLSGMAISRCNLSKASIWECRLDDMTIDGIPVTALLAAYHDRASAPPQS